MFGNRTKPTRTRLLLRMTINMFSDTKPCFFFVFIDKTCHYLSINDVKQQFLFGFLFLLKIYCINLHPRTHSGLSYLPTTRGYSVTRGQRPTVNVPKSNNLFVIGQSWVRMFIRFIDQSFG